MCHLTSTQWRSQGHKPQGQGLNPQGRGQGLQNCPRGRGLVLEDSNTGKHRIKCFGEAPNTLHIYSVIGNGQNPKLLPLKPFVQNMQWLVKSVSSSFSKDLSHEAKDSTLKARAQDQGLQNCPRGFSEDSNTASTHSIKWDVFAIHAYCISS